MRNIVFYLLLSFCLTALGQSGYADLSSPQAAVKTHLENLQSESYNDSLAALPFMTQKRGLNAAKEAAIKWKRVLDGKGLFIYTDEIPDQKNYYDSTLKKAKFVVLDEFPSIFLFRSTNGNWRYSESSIDQINELYSETFRFGTGWLLEFGPRLGTRKILGLYSYQYFLILILAFVSAVIYKVFAFLTERIFSRLLRKTGYKEENGEKFLWMVARPTSVFIIILLLLIFMPALQLPANYGQYVSLFLRLLLPLFGTVIAYRVVNIASVFLGKLASTTESTLDDQLVPLLRKTLKTFVLIVGTLIILDNLNVPILPLLTGLSIGGLAFALAAQDTIKNFFGSVMIFVDKPFQVGDWITADGLDGTVEEVGFRSSRVRTFRNSMIYVPNGKLADNTIDNHGLRKYRRFFTQIAVTYDTPPELIEAFVDGLRAIVDKHPNTWKDNYHVYLNDMADSSLNIMFYIFFQVPTWGEELRCRQEILLSVIRLAKQLGVNFAFPTQTLHVENLPGQPSLSPNYMSGAEAQAILKSN